MNEPMRIRCKADELKERLLPHLKGQVYHVTSPEGYRGIRESGFIKNNHDGSLETHWPNKTDHVYCRRNKLVPLFDLRAADDARITRAAKEYICPFGSDLGNRVFLLILSRNAWPKVTTQESLLWPQGVPYIESWYRDCVPLEEIEKVIEVTIEPPLRISKEPKTLADCALQLYWHQRQESDENKPSR